MFSPHSSTDAVTVRWLGVAGVELAWHGKSLLLDPYFSRLPLRRLIAGRPQPDPARIETAWRNLTASPVAMAVSHTHADHALDIPDLAQRTPALVLGTTDLDALLTRAGLAARVTVCPPGHIHDLPSFGRLAVFAGSHGRFLFGRPPLPGHLDPSGSYPLSAREYRAGDVLVFDVTIANQRFVHVGSAGVPTGVLPEGACEALFLCVPGWQTDANYPAVFLQRLRPRVIIPIHTDRMTCPLTDPCAAHPGGLAARWLGLPGFLTRLARVAPGIPVQMPQLWAITKF